MNRISRYMRKYGWLATCVSGLFTILTACNSELPEVEPTRGNGNPLTISGTIHIPEMDMVTTRALGENSGANLVLTLLEFDKGATASSSFRTDIFHTEITSTTTQVNNGVDVNFNVTLKSATTPKVLHFILTTRSITTGAGSEATILPALTVGGTTPNSQQEAYWGKVEFPDGYTTIDAEGKEQLRSDVQAKLQNVPLIRNFAKITVTENLSNFELLGFEVINAPTSGTIAPWNQTEMKIPELLDGNTMKGYTAIAPTYNGFVPANVGFRNTEAEVRNMTAQPNQALFSSAARYIYEHPYESTRRTYLIIEGNYTYTDEENVTRTTRGYYKVDIGNPGTDGTFNYYNIIRNINYNIRITQVLSAGSTTVAAAINGAPLNNLIAATETSGMLNVSDGENMLIVNDTNHIFIDSEQTIDIMYRYIEGVTGTKTENNLKTTLKPIGLEPGPVIKSVGPKETWTNPNNANEHWVKYTITPNAPGIETLSQNVTIVDGEGLGRTIHLYLRKPFQYAPIKEGSSTLAIVRTGHANSYGNNDTSEAISNQAGQELTVYFNLPDGMDEYMFPLEFRLESLNQGIENNKIGNLVVWTGPSLFDPSKTTISYIKTVSYSEYLYNYFENTNDIDINSSNNKHTVRCRFTTITSVTGAGEIRIHNEYFNPDASATFTRN